MSLLILSLIPFNLIFSGHLLPENWQACLDDATQCYYYWNITTNEVQWIPPVATIPPPPPPPSDDATESKDGKSETENLSEKEESATNEPCIEDSLPTNKDTLLAINTEEVVEINKETETKKEAETKIEDVQAIKKEKDKELMNQIKERIKRKKEEKLKKEMEEKESGDIDKIQKEKEESLREKLINKKLERESKTNSKQNETEIEDSNSNLFSVDIFASVKRDQKITEQSDDIAEKKSNTNSTSESLTSIGWGLIDAGYGDDDDDDDEESVEEDENVEIKTSGIVVNDLVSKETNSEISATNKQEQKVENNENYADMLLEGLKI